MVIKGIKKTIMLLSITLLATLPSCKKVDDNAGKAGGYYDTGSSQQEDEDDSI
jgi:hypothetical protein